jgi:ATP-dependent protease ClpP protease subunit
MSIKHKCSLINKTSWIIFLLFSISLSRAEVGYLPGSTRGTTTTPPTLILSGEITPDDVLQLKKLLPIARDNAQKVFKSLKSGLPKGNIALELDTLGGDISAALAIGTIARNEEFTVVVRETQTCASSCVFVLAGAPYRYVTGRVGIHRPYFPLDKITTPEGQKRQYSRIETAITNYLASMNVDPGIYSRMLRIPPQEVLWLNEYELEKYGLLDSDPYYTEADNTKSSNALSLNKKEYLLLMSRLNQKCKGDLSGECFFEEYLKIKPGTR